MECVDWKMLAKQRWKASNPEMANELILVYVNALPQPIQNNADVDLHILDKLDEFMSTIPDEPLS